MAVGEEKRLISREPAGKGGGRGGRWMRDQKGRGERSWGKGEQEKFTGEWVDATRPSNRRLDYSARHIGGRVYVCECARACVRSFFLLYPSSRPRISSLSLSSSSLLPRSIGLPRVFLLSVRFLRNRSRSLALAWIACVNAYPMVNELAVISILERLAPPRRAAPSLRARRRRDPRRECPCKDAGRDYLPATYLPTYLPSASNN